MLINVLCDYYDILAKAEKVLPDGYSKVNIHYLVSLTENGTIDEIINYQNKIEQKIAKGKIKEVWNPREVVMPQRTEKPGIDANIVEHRPLYLFGLNFDNEKLSPKDRTSKAEKSHKVFVDTNLKFLEDLNSPVINAFRQFLFNWKPEEETENFFLLNLGKNYMKSNFVFCLSGFPDRLLHEETLIKEKWEKKYQETAVSMKDNYITQCAVSGEKSSIARIHNKIKGVYGGLATGSVLIGFNNYSENSYGKEQSYNSNISETIMKKYTEALNYLLKDQTHKILLDDITIIFWAMDAHEDYQNIIMAMLLGQDDKINAEQTEHMLKNLLSDSKKLTIKEERLQSLDKLKPDTLFYMVGIKPNSSRLAVKFIYRRKYAEVLWNIAQFQKDLQISKEFHPVSINRIKAELTSSKSNTDSVNPALISKLMEAILYGKEYPISLLETVVRRVKTDSDSKLNSVRAGIIKACINRNYQKEELSVALNKQNNTPAYVCGRLFAVLEKLQQDVSNNSLNRTIKDTYFSSAVSKPVIVFPKLIKLAQNHLNKLKNPIFYNQLLGEIIDLLDDEFPDTLTLAEQGKFIIGYYQQYQSFFEKKEKKQDVEKEENENGN